MADEVITTGVDTLLELLKNVNKIPLAEAAQKLGLSVGLLQSWVDFLVEEEIVGVEYKFTKPIIYLNKMPKESEVSVKEDESLTIEAHKEDFKSRASQRNIPVDKVEFFWRNHVKDAVNAKKDFFFREARKRGLVNIDSLWDEYIGKLLAS